MTKRTSNWLVAGLLVCPLLASAAPRLEERAGAREAVPFEYPTKPTGPIAIEHRFAGEPVVGVPLTLDVRARAAPDARDVRIEADASVPSAVIVAPPTLESADGNLYRWTITVVPLAADAGYLHVIVSARVDGVAQADAVTVSLRSAGAQAAVPRGPDAGEENLIALPVRETP